MLAPPPQEQMPRILKLIPKALLEAPHLTQLLSETQQEIGGDYEFSLRKTISK